MNYVVLDLETTTKEIFKRKGNFLFNEIIAASCKTLESHYTYYHTDNLLNNIFKCLNKVDVIVGHNIKYDLLYLWKYPELQEFFKRGGKIWDTQLAEYILTGQQAKFSALRDLAVNTYGCKEREKYMENYWEKNLMEWLLIEIFYNETKKN